MVCVLLQPIGRVSASSGFHPWKLYILWHSSWLQCKCWANSVRSPYVGNFIWNSPAASTLSYLIFWWDSSVTSMIAEEELLLCIDIYFWALGEKKIMEKLSYSRLRVKAVCTTHYSHSQPEWSFCTSAIRRGGVQWLSITATADAIGCMEDRMDPWDKLPSPPFLK